MAADPLPRLANNAAIQARFLKIVYFLTTSISSGTIFALLDAAALEHIHGGGKFELKVWADPQERPSDRHTSDADSATMFVDVGAWAKA
jgi:hypothetical protein